MNYIFFVMAGLSLLMFMFSIEKSRFGLAVLFLIAVGLNIMAGSL